MSDLRLEYLKYTDEQQDMLQIACRIFEAVRARDQSNATPDKHFTKHLKREVEGETVTPLDELTMESITKACQKSKREGVLSSTDLKEVMIEDGELDRWWLPPAAEEMEVDEPEPPAKRRLTCALLKRVVLQVNTEGVAQGAAEQEEGSSPTPQNTTQRRHCEHEKGLQEGSVRSATMRSWSAQAVNAFETRNYECI
ncbi:hypothetical protein BC834DRAFT_848769, partial [Gloeopeniophorella convolvens]